VLSNWSVASLVVATELSHGDSATQRGDTQGKRIWIQYAPRPRLGVGYYAENRRSVAVVACFTEFALSGTRARSETGPAFALGDTRCSPPSMSF